jgi:hypothetical protein
VEADGRQESLVRVDGGRLHVDGGKQAHQAWVFADVQQPERGLHHVARSRNVVSKGQELTSGPVFLRYPRGEKLILCLADHILGHPRTRVSVSHIVNNILWDKTPPIVEASRSASALNQGILRAKCQRTPFNKIYTGFPPLRAICLH